MKISHAILSAAVSGMTLGLSQATAWAAPDGSRVVSGFDSATGSQLDADAGAKHACKGQNACKGQGWVQNTAVLQCLAQGGSSGGG